MNIVRDPEEETLLARRLATLEVPGTEDLVRRSLATFRASTRRRPRALTWAVVAAAVVIAAIAAGPVVSAAGPFAEWLLQSIGLAPKDSSKIQTTDSTATSSGKTVKLVGAYGDAVHTAVFLHLDGGLWPGILTVTTGSGQRLAQSGLAADRDGRVVVRFAPITNPNSDGEDLSLRITTLVTSPGPPGSSIFVPSGTTKVITGEWVLHFRLQVARNQAVATPSSGKLGNVDVSFAAVGGTGDSVFVGFDTEGASIDELLKSPREGSKASSRQGALEFHIYDQNGKELKVLSTGGYTKADKTSPPDVLAKQVRMVRWQYYLRGSGPGSYRGVLSYEGHELRTTFTLSTALSSGGFA
jgi:hypothetical protein